MTSGPWDDPALLTAICGVAGTAAPEGRRVAPPDHDAAEALAFHAEVHAAGPVADGAARRIVPGDTALGGHVFGPGPLSPRWRAIWIEAAPEILACRGRQSAETVRGRLTMIWCRAESRLRAREAPRGSLGGMDRCNLRVHSVETPYAGFFLTQDYVISHDLYGGGESDRLHRAVFVMADAVTVLPYDPGRDRVLVIEQVRASPIARGDPFPWLIEPVAGRIDPGDTPEAAARREAMEEARVTVAALHKVGEYYPSTGAFSEYLYSYIGIADLPDTAGTLGGLETEGEDIRGFVMPRAELMARIAAGEVPVGPLILSAFWLEANAARLRAGA